MLNLHDFSNSDEIAGLVTFRLSRIAVLISMCIGKGVEMFGVEQIKRRD